MQSPRETSLVEDPGLGAGLTVLTVMAAGAFGVIGLALLLVMPIAGILTGGIGGLLLTGVLGSHLQR